MADIEIINGKKYSLSPVTFREQFLKTMDNVRIKTIACLYCEFHSRPQICDLLNNKHQCIDQTTAWKPAKHTDILSGL